MNAQLEERAQRLLSRYSEFRFVDNPCFKERKTRRVILSPMPDEVKYLASIEPSYLSEEGEDGSVNTMCSAPLLSKAQEQHLFRKINFLKYRANYYRRRITHNPTEELCDRFELDIAEFERIRNIIISANLRLVISIIKKHRDLHNKFHDRFSDGISYLYLAVDRFDYSYGWKFSTYATWALIRNFASSVPKEYKRAAKEKAISDLVEDPDAFPQVATEDTYTEKIVQYNETAAMINRLLSTIDRKSAHIIREVGGIGCKQRTLENVAEELHITKERVRQIRLRGLKELQEKAQEMFPALCREAQEGSNPIGVRTPVCPICKGVFATTKPNRIHCSRFCANTLKGKKSPKPTKDQMVKDWKKYNGAITTLGRKYGVNAKTVKRWAMGYGFIPFDTLEFGVL